MLIIVMPAFAFVSSLILTGFVRRYALSRNILDVPGPRASHSVPTPRGGGMGFVAVFLGGLFMFRYLYPELSDIWMALSGGVVVAIFGWWDDCRNLTVRVRLVVHAVAALWVLCQLGGFSQLDLGIIVINLGILGSLLAWLAIVWCINLYNFMDGIDGLAAGEALMVGGFAGAFALIKGALPLAMACWLLAAAVGGFLVWNWPPAKIFMGDVGSSFLGFIMATLAVGFERKGVFPALLWLILLAVFIVDATATLCLRIVQGKKWYEPHREHAYQMAVRTGYSHGQVTTTVMIIDVLLGIVGLATVFLGLPLLVALAIVIPSLSLLWGYFVFFRKLKLS